MISKAGRKSAYHLQLFLLLLGVSGCVSHIVPECPIGVPLRDFVLQPLSVDEQLAIKRLDAGNSLGKIASNDASLKAHVRVLESVVIAHDSTLESCDN